MISLKTGDVFGEQAEVLVNTVNCVGVMGRGIALQFKKSFPDNFEDYKKACDRREVEPGKIFIHETGEFFPRYIFNFPTKRHWRGKSKIEDIDAGMMSLISEVKRLNIASIAIPPLGSGLGGLDWKDVLPIIEGHLQAIPNVDVAIFEPNRVMDAKPPRNIEVPKMTPGRAALILLINRYFSAALDFKITLLEVHKLMYFLQIAGEPLNLNYKKADYGPYAENLSDVLHILEGHYVSGYGSGGDQPEKTLNLIPGALKDANAMLENYPDTLSRIERVIDLVDGFETSYGLELLSATHWLITKENATTCDDVIARFGAWNKRKAEFSMHQIDVACETLDRKGWTPSFAQG